MSRVFRVASALAVAVAVVPATAPAAAPACAAVRASAKDWSTLGRPTFPAGPRSIDSYAIAARDPMWLFATNGVAIVGTRDGGCTWQTALHLTSVQAGFDGFASRITAFDAAVDASGRAVIVAGVAETESFDNPVPRAHVIVSRDGGASWTGLNAGLDQEYRTPRLVRLARSDPRVAYVQLDGIDVPPDGDLRLGTRRAFYALRDDTWVRRDAELSLAGVPVVTNSNSLAMWAADEVVVDERDAAMLWLRTKSTIYRSFDGGETLKALDNPLKRSPPPHSFSALAATRSRSGQTVVVGYEPELPLFVRWEDDKLRGARMLDGLSGMPRSAAFVGTDVHVAATERGVFAWNPQKLFFHDISPRDRRTIVDLASATVAGKPVVVGRTRTDIVVRLPHLPPPPRPKPLRPPPPVVDVHVDPAELVDRLTPGLLPRRSRLRLGVGESARVPYRLALPSRRAVDVYFLVDTSESMGAEIESLTLGLAEIVRRLRAAGVDPWFGIGEYRGYDSEAYHRVKDVGPPGRELEAAFESLRLSGGGNGTETQLPALYQTATGEGQVALGSNIPPGQQANFRPGSLRVIVHATDEPFATAPPRPTYEQVGEALREVDAKQLGLAFPGTPDPLSLIREEAYDGLVRVASLSGALAPPAGADCDGDGRTGGTRDVPGGSPLVCEIPNADAAGPAVLAPTIVDLIMALEDRADIAVAAVRGADVVASVTPSSVADIDLKEEQVLPFAVTLVCPTEESVHDVELAATARGHAIARASVRLECVAPRVAVPPVVVPPRPRTAAVPVTINLPPPQPIPHGNPNVQANSQVQAQTNLNGQPVGAAALQERAKLAVALGDEEARGDGTELAMSDWRRGTAADPTPWLAGAALTTAAAAASFGRRRQAGPAVARARAPIRGTRRGGR